MAPHRHCRQMPRAYVVEGAYERDYITKTQRIN